MNIDDAIKGPANKNSITTLHGNQPNIGIIISPTPAQTSNNGGLNFYKFSLDISNIKITLDTRKPFSKKLAKKNATLNKYNEGANIVAPHDKPINNKVSIIILLFQQLK